MEDKLKQFELSQEKITQEIQDLKDEIARNQQDLLNKMDDKLSQLFAKLKGAEKGKVHGTHEIDSSPIIRGTQEFSPRVTLFPSGLQSNMHDPSNVYGTRSSNMGMNPAKVPDLDDPKELKKLRLGQPEYSNIDDDDKFKYLEERIKDMEGTYAFSGTDMMELSLVPDLIPPQNFKVQSPLIQKETTTLSIKSLEIGPTFYAKLFGSTIRDFVDLVVAGEAIEHAIKSGKLSDPEVSKKSYVKKKDNEVNMVGHDKRSYSNYQSSPKITYSTWYPKNVTTSSGSQNKQHEPSSSKTITEKESFRPIPIPYKELYANLLEE
ncbi:hypothetical protein GQ457_14G017490 [Hibiscus cannabinus]